MTVSYFVIIVSGMQVRKALGIAFFLIAISCFNYALIYGHREKTADRTLRQENRPNWSQYGPVNNTLDGGSVLSKLPELETTQQTSLLTTTELSVCNGIGLQGALDVGFDQLERAYWSVLNLNPSVSRNATFLGNFSTVNVSNYEAVYLGQPNCIPSQSVAIIIPFRDRESHLKILLGHLIPILKRQGPRFSIFVVEQVGTEPFNKGRLMNTGFKYATVAGIQSGTPFDCFIFQDVDLLMENDKLMLRCSGEVYVDHLSIAIDKFKYVPVCCGMTVGGVLAFTEEQFYQVNGFPNSFWGWGGEDDAINDRIASKKLRIVRPYAIAGRYTMIRHERDKFNPPNPQRWRAIKLARKRIEEDGLTDLDTTIVAVDKYRFFTRVYVDVGTAG